MPSLSSQFERYVGYKSHFIALVAGILLGIFTNYIAMFIPMDVKGFFFSLIAIFIVCFFFITRFFVPSIAVFQELPENLKPTTFFTFKKDDAFDVLAKRFIFKANMAVTRSNTLFTLPNSGLKEPSSLWRPNYFFSLNEEKHRQKLNKTLSILGLTDSEMKELQQEISKVYKPFLVQTGQTFKYRSIENSLLRGKGVFFLTVSGKLGVGCIINPSPFSALSRHFEQYHINLRDHLKHILNDLLEDEKFQYALSKIFSKK
jgi:hypothetical protein